MRAPLVCIDRFTGAAHGITGRLPVGAILVLPGGVVVRVREDGGLDDLRPGGHPRPGIAADPAARRDQ